MWLLAQQTATISDELGGASLWGEHGGLVGLMVFGMFFLTGIVVIGVLHMHRATVKSHREERTEILDRFDMREKDRDEKFTSTIDKNGERMEKAFDRLTDAIHEKGNQL